MAGIPEHPVVAEEGDATPQNAEPHEASLPLSQPADASAPAAASHPMQPPSQPPHMMPPSTVATPSVPRSEAPPSSAAPAGPPQRQAAPSQAVSAPQDASLKARPAASLQPAAGSGLRGSAAGPSEAQPSQPSTPQLNPTLATPQAPAAQAADQSSSEDDDDAWAMLHGSSRRTPKGAQAQSAAQAAADEAAKELLLGRKRKGSPLESRQKGGKQSGAASPNCRSAPPGLEIKRGAVESLPSIGLLKCFQQLQGGVQRSLPQVPPASWLLADGYTELVAVLCTGLHGLVCDFP